MLNQQQIFPSKKGFVIYIPLVILLAIEIPYIWAGMYKGAALCFCIMASVYFPVLFNTWYAISNEGILQIKCGWLFNMKLDVASISKIKNKRTALSSPALSLDRIEIFYNKFDSVIVSPYYKVKFVESLKRLNPNIIY